ncbi:MAG: addiction module protein [Planctomycetota bacterium]|jgi:putative addiction module component (TIGR02574 family)
MMYPYSMRSHEDILKAALELPEQERFEVMRKILESLDGEPDQEATREWAIEIERRIGELTAGTVKTQPAREAIEQARSKIIP